MKWEFTKTRNALFLSPSRSDSWSYQILYLVKFGSSSGRVVHSIHSGSAQFSSVADSCPTFCDHMDCRRPGFPVHHQIPELTQTHVHRVSDAIQLSHSLLSPSPTFNLFQHQGLFQWVSSLHQVAKVLEFQLQHQSFQWIFRTDLI